MQDIVLVVITITIYSIQIAKMWLLQQTPRIQFLPLQRKSQASSSPKKRSETQG